MTNKTRSLATASPSRFCPRAGAIGQRSAEPKGLEELLSGVSNANDSTASLCAASLRALQFQVGLHDTTIEEFLGNDEWRFQVFQLQAEEVLDSFLLFLTERKLQRQDEWLVRPPHVLAFECERATDKKRRDFLFVLTLFTSICSEIYSPVARLLTGHRRAELNDATNIWTQHLTMLARESAAWVAARIRGLAGAVAPYT